MPSAHLALREEDAIKLVLEFLENRELHITQVSLERETGVINGIYSHDVLFLRQLILDGQWDDVIEFVQPLHTLAAFDQNRFHFVVYKHKYIELLCIRSEVSALQTVDVAVEEVVKCLNELQRCAPSKEEYSALCLLLTLPRLSDHAEYSCWNPSGGRVECFRQVLPLVERLLPAEKRLQEARATAANDRLLQLIIKGILYESCVNFCQRRATATCPSDSHGQVQFSKLLGSAGFSDADLSLLSWLECIPAETFTCPFEQQMLNVDVERLEKPCLEASWTEHMLVTPIKPKTFPHSAMPTMRPRSADIMSRSLTPHLEGLPFGLAAQRRHLMALSVGDLSTMSKSFAGFHLTGKKSMNTSVDRLFEESTNVFTGSADECATATDKPTAEAVNGKEPPNNAEKKVQKAEVRLPLPGKPPAPVKSAEKKGAGATTKVDFSKMAPVPNRKERPDDDKVDVGDSVSITSTELYKEYQKQKLVIQEQLASQNKMAEEYEKQLRQLRAGTVDNRLQEALIDKNQSNRISERQFTTRTNSETPDLPLPKNPSSSSERNSIGSSSSSSNSTPQGHQQQLQQPQQSQSQQPPSQQQPVQAQHGPFNPYRVSTETDENSAATPKPKFVAVTTVEDVQAVRAAEFHPSGKYYAIGSNSKTLRVCAYPKITDLREDHRAYQPSVLCKRMKHHKGSIYCLSWNATGDLIATGSNDKTVKLTRFNSETCSLEGEDMELSMHDGTVRDVCFVEDLSNKSSLLISGGAGDCKIYVTDCVTATPFQALSGHSGHVLSLYTWGGAMFVSGSQDKTVRFWDLRTRGCTNLITTPSATGATQKGSPVATVCVDPSGRLLVSGHEDASCMLYDIRGGRVIQCFKPHTSDIRTVRFSPRAYYLLSGSYDNKITLTDLQGDLTLPLPSVVVGTHEDKVIQARWHPSDFSFLSTSADKTATLWALPPN